MVILSRKTAGQNPASTAALRRVAISLSSQRRALRHPAGAVQKASSSPAEMRKRIRQEVMNGTFAQGTKSGSEVLAGDSNREHRVFNRSDAGAC